MGMQSLREKLKTRVMAEIDMAKEFTDWTGNRSMYFGRNKRSICSIERKGFPAGRVI